MYSFNSRIRYSEIDSDYKLTLGGLTNYFQDCSVFHSESAGLGTEYLVDNHLAWVLSFWQICIEEMPKLNDEVVISTWPYDMSAFWGLRNFTMTGTEGRRLAYANSVWVLVDTDTWKPTKVPEEMAEKYGIDKQLEMDCSPRKIKIPEGLEDAGSIIVPSYFIDTNQHMNNEKYIMLAMDELEPGREIREIRVEYRKEAKLGDTIYKKVKRESNQTTVVLAGWDGKAYATILFLTR